MNSDGGLAVPQRGPMRELRAKAERVIAGTQTGRYKKADLARDILTLLDRIERMRIKPDETPRLPEVEIEDGYGV